MSEPIRQVLWLLVTFGSWIIPGLLGYRLGLRSQRHIEMLKAKNAIFAEIDQIQAVADVADNLRPVLRAGQTRLEKLVFAVSSQLRCQKRRARIETAWADYQKLDIGAFPTTMASSDSAAIAEARARMSQPLKHLRDEILNA
jgi:hypothetical protein